MESRNKFEMCRLCLCENECFVNIFEMNEWQGYVASEVISDLLQFQVSETDGYPHVVCLTCLTKLTDFRLFKECCQKSRDMYGNTFTSRESLEEHKPEMEVGSDLEFCDQGPLREASSPVTVKSEEVIIDSSSYEISENSLNATEVSCGPILLKYEVLPFSKDSHTQDEVIDSEVSENQEKVESTAALMQDYPQEEKGGKGTLPEEIIIGRNGMLECHCCRKLLKTKESLKQHLATHGIGNFFKCDVCGKTLVSKSKLKIHIRMHTGERPYKCTVCSALFSEYSNLKAHMRIHTNVKPFKCKECHLSFRYCSSLKEHMRVHSNLKPYSCGVCHAAFRLKYSMMTHMKTHSGCHPYKCTVCSKTFSQSDSLRKHQVVHSGERTNPCPHCSKRFSERRNLKRHLKTVCVEKC